MIAGPLSAGVDGWGALVKGLQHSRPVHSLKSLAVHCSVNYRGEDRPLAAKR